MKVYHLTEKKKEKKKNQYLDTRIIITIMFVGCVGSSSGTTK